MTVKPYYEDSAVTIYHGDCREILPTTLANVVVTDPPYGINLGSHAAAKDGRDHLLRKQAYLSYDDTPESFRENIVPRIVKSLECCQGNGIVFCSGSSICHLPRPSCVGGVFIPAAVGRTSWGFTNLSVCAMYGVSPHTSSGCRATAIISNETAQPNGHPVPKPMGWMLWAVSLASLPHDTVLDPFCGSGTTLRAAKDLGRKAIGIEIEERYCEIAARRCAQEVLSL